MVTPSVGSVILISFPFSDLSQRKMRPAVVVANAERDDWILCQITSNPYGDRRAVSLTERSFSKGSLHRDSFARPAKLFTASQELMVSQIGTLTKSSLSQVIDAIVDVFRTTMPEREST